MIYRIAAIILLFAIVLFISLKVSKTEARQTKENPYNGLRNMALSTTASMLKLSLPKDKLTVYGVVMDWGMEQGTATIVAYQTGDASLYLNPGGGIIGGISHNNVSKAAKQFVSVAQQYVNKAMKTATHPLPKTDNVNFYLLTNQGIYVGHETIKNFENNSSQWLPLFEAGNELITELRKTNQSKE